MEKTRASLFMILMLAIAGLAGWAFIHAVMTDSSSSGFVCITMLYQLRMLANKF